MCVQLGQHNPDLRPPAVDEGWGGGEVGDLSSRHLSSRELPIGPAGLEKRGRGTLSNSMTENLMATLSLPPPLRADQMFRSGEMRDQTAPATRMAAAIAAAFW